MTKFLKYARLYRAFLKASFLADLEYRANFVSRIVTDVFWYAAQIIVFEALYRHTDSIGGWSHGETRVFLGILFLVDALFMIFFSENFDRLTEKVRKGDLDLLLAKPVNSQFMISCQRVSTAMVGNFLIGGAWFLWSVWQIEGASLWKISYLLILLPCGLAVFYSIRFFFAATAVIFTQSDNLQYLWYQLYKLGMRPDGIYNRYIRYLVMSFLPVAFIASVPARLILRPFEPWLLLHVILVTMILIYLSREFWKFSLRHYTSASS